MASALGQRATLATLELDLAQLYANVGAWERARAALERAREEAGRGRFREDLYYRIGVVVIRLPPLRERIEDLPELARRILAQAAEELGRPAPSLSGAAMRALLSQCWPATCASSRTCCARRWSWQATT
ncbi:MAG TPA: hypothetical protein VIL20_09135 [Sandaracinaceae bacterium]